MWDLCLYIVKYLIGYKHKNIFMINALKRVLTKNEEAYLKRID